MADVANPAPWAPRERRLCHCGMYRVPHLVTKSIWYRHRQRQAWLERQAIQENIPPVDFNWEVIDASQLEREPRLSGTPIFNDQEDSTEPAEATPVFEDALFNEASLVFHDSGPVQQQVLVYASQDQQPEQSASQETARGESFVPESVVSEREDTLSILSHSFHQSTVGKEEEHQRTESNHYDLNMAYIAPVPINTAGENENHDPSSSSSESSTRDIPDNSPPPSIHGDVDTDIDADRDDGIDASSETDNDIGQRIQNPSYSNPYYEDVEDVDDIGDAPSSENPESSGAEDGVEVDDDDNEGPEVLTEFPYSMIPNVVLEPAMMRHLRLMKVRMEGNVAQDIHMRYIQAVQAFDNSEISVTDEATAKRELGVITEIYHVRYDVCRNNCICYVAFPLADKCHICNAERRDSNGKPYHTAYVKTTMKYKESFANQETPQSSVRDYWDSFLFKMVKNNRGLWTDSRDVGFIFSTDGFSLFKIGQYDIWPLLLINCNLPPSERVLKKNLILCGIIPGPGNPKDLGSFLKPMIDEFLILQVGVKAWDGLRKERFTLHANIALVAGDTIAMAKLMKWTGPNSFRYCRFCAIYGISEGHIYCPLEPPRDRKDALGGEVRRKGSNVSKKNPNFPEKSWDAKNLPVWTDAQVRENQKTVEETMDLQWGKMMGTNGEPVFSSLLSVVYPWTFTPDVMHLVDENTPRLYLAQWMGVFRDKELALHVKMAQAGVDPSQVESLHAQSEGMSQSQAEVQQAPQFDCQTSTQQGDSLSQIQGERRKRRKGRRGVSFNADIEENYVEDAFILPKRMWDKIGEEIADSRASIPSAFGKAFRDIKYHASYKATELMNFMHLISPIVLNQRLPAEYYSHWHHLVLASEKARRYQLSMEDVAEMERDMVQVVTGYERLYYQYKLTKIRGCTTQVHGLLHLAMAMKICGPNPIYHQYPMERTCGMIKAMCHSRSSANRNLSLQLLERERLRYLPLIALVPPDFSDTTERGLFVLGEKDKVAYSAEYPDCLLMGPKISRRLNQYERNHLRQFHADVIGVPVKSAEIVGNPVLFSGVFKLWGRAVAGRVLSNSSEHEVVGSAISNPKPGVCSSRRNDSFVRYILSGNSDGDNDISYFGKVMFFMPYEIHNDERLEDEPERFMMAYIQRLEVGRVRKLKLAYIIKKQQRVLKEFVNLSDLQELIGYIKSRGKEFLVSRTSCFWPKKNFAWREVIDNEALFIGANAQ